MDAIVSVDLRALQHRLSSVLAPLLSTTTADSTADKLNKTFKELHKIWRSLGPAYLPQAVLEDCLSVAQQACGPAHHRPTRRLAAILQIVADVVNVKSKTIEGRQAPAQVIAAKLPPAQLLDCIRRWSTPAAAGPSDASAADAPASDDGDPSAAALSGACHLLTALLSALPEGTADNLAAATPGGRSAMVDALVAAAHNSRCPEARLAVLGALIPFMERWRAECLPRVAADQPLLLSAVEALRRLDRPRNAFPFGYGAGGTPHPALDCLHAIAVSSDLGIAHAALQLPGLLAAALAAFEAYAGPEATPDRDRASVGLALQLLQKLVNEEEMGSKAAADAAAVEIATFASDAALSQLLKCVSADEDEYNAMHAGTVLAYTTSCPAAMAVLQRRLEPRAMVAAVFAALQHPELRNLGDMAALPDDFYSFRWFAAMDALGSLANWCQQPGEGREGVQRELSRGPLPPLAVRRLVEAIRYAAEPPRFPDWDEEPPPDCELVTFVAHILLPVARRCARGGKLRPLVNAPAALVAAIRVVMNQDEYVGQLDDLAALVAAAKEFLKEVHASRGFCADMEYYALDELRTAVEGAEAWLVLEGRGDGSESPVVAAMVEAVLDAGRARDEGAPGAQQAAPAPAPASPQEPVPPAPAAAVCGGCGAASGPEGAKLKLCSGCRAVRYCGEACMVAAWPLHKAACKAAKRAAQEAAAPVGSATTVDAE